MPSVSGIVITESTSAAATTNPTSINRIYLVGTSTSASINLATSVSSASDAIAKFPGIKTITVAALRAIFRNNPDSKVYFVSAKDPAITDMAIATPHLVFAASTLAKAIGLDLGFVIAPEAVSITVQADRTTVYSAFENLAQKTNWIHFWNGALDTDTEVKAIAERALYSSNFGHSAYFYSVPTDLENERVPLTAVASAIALLAGRSNSYRPPAGADFPISGIKTFNNYVDTSSKYDDLKAQNINLVQFIPGYGHCLWLARTLATDQKFMQINTRIAISLLTEQLKNALIPLLFQSSDPGGYIRREIVRRATSLLQQAYEDGGLSGATSEEAYKIDEVEEVVENLRKVTIKIYARFVDCLEMIEIQLVNSDQATLLAA